MKQPLLVIFIGVPGSGKTYFATQLAKRIHAIRLNSDAMRLAIFGSTEQIDRVYHSPQKATINSHTFGAMDYVTRTLLSQGKSVVYEAIQRTQKDRKNMEKLADSCGARLVLVSMMIDEDIAVKRIQERQEAEDSRIFTDARARSVVKHFSEGLEPLERTDYLVAIDGTAPFEDQYQEFEAFIAS